MKSQYMDTLKSLFTTFCSWFLLTFSKKITFFHVKHMVLHKMFLEFLSRKKWFLASTATSCSSLFLIVYDILHNFIFKDVSSLFSNILHMLQHKMFVEVPSRHHHFSHSLQLRVYLNGLCMLQHKMFVEFTRG